MFFNVQMHIHGHIHDIVSMSLSFFKFISLCTRHFYMFFFFLSTDLELKLSITLQALQSSRVASCLSENVFLGRPNTLPAAARKKVAAGQHIVRPQTRTVRLVQFQPMLFVGLQEKLHVFRSQCGLECSSCVQKVVWNMCYKLNCLLLQITLEQEIDLTRTSAST